MKANAVVFTDVNKVAYLEVEAPDPGPDDVVVDVEHSWISIGTEQSFLRGERITGEQVTREGDILPFPQVAGYQKVGIVREVGSRVTSVKPGDRVFASVSGVEGMAFSTGGHVNPAVTHVSQIWKLPDTPGGPEALAYAPLVLAQVGYNCGIRPGITPGDRAVVIGDGLVGQWAAQTLLSRGADVTVLGRNDGRLGLLPAAVGRVNLRKVSMEEAVEGFSDIQAVVDTVGAMSVFRAILPKMKVNSHLVSAGFLGNEGMVDIQELRPLEITLHSPSGWQPERMDATLAAIADGRIQTIPLITHTLPAHEAAKAWDMIQAKQEFFLGVVLDWR
ncbi:alcohol dehydrogenase catalytic domain-containing protein [Paenibacillus nasutitermitis]|uniref:Chlorophyll synthesis pathway protein BchC n=1 Tax=Paenibacillus nasutitermitis TaxID=1652958 RepID=A0A917E100_9BACL|nr:alcohol dehydrogenase catalytic domain-containing protein [Paenibacillus nasutitermitis]GGD93154.1 chlorophyll synthesis pathway protein BchC [Paenibacillus nasutitermitis]